MTTTKDIKYSNADIIILIIILFSVGAAMYEYYLISLGGVAIAWLLWKIERVILNKYSKRKDSHLKPKNGVTVTNRNLEDEHQFLEEEKAVQRDGAFIYTSEDGTEIIQLDNYLADYKDWLIEKGILKEEKYTKNSLKIDEKTGITILSLKKRLALKEKEEYYRLSDEELLEVSEFIIEGSVMKNGMLIINDQSLLLTKRELDKSAMEPIVQKMVVSIDMRYRDIPINRDKKEINVPVKRKNDVKLLRSLSVICREGYIIKWID